jgi:iron complex transport system substrate-binding protein
MRIWGWIIAISLAGCSPNASKIHIIEDSQASKVVSLDLCADQAVLSLLPQERITAISPEVDSDPAFAQPAAAGLPRIQPSLERVLALKPSIVVRSYGGGANMDRQLRAAGVRVVQLDYTQALADVAPALRKTATALAAEPRGDALAADFEKRLSAHTKPRHVARMLYITPGNVTAGTDTFIGQMMAAAGYRAYSDRAGWPTLPLEAMQARPPTFVLRGFFDSAKHRQDAWSLSRHPALTKAIAKAKIIDVPGGWVACGNHLSILAIEKMAAARPKVLQ